MIPSVREHGSDAEATIELTPLIDIVFILLLFFLVTANFSEQQAIVIHRPVAGSAKDAPSEPLSIVIDAQGHFFIEGEAASDSTLRSWLSNQLRADREKTVLLIVDEQSPASSLVRATDMAQLAGANNIAISTEASAP